MPDSELHDAHVGAWVAWQREPELPEYADEVFDLSCQLYDLEHGPCQDVAGKQKRMEGLKDRLKRISLDCTHSKGKPGDADGTNISWYREMAKQYAKGILVMAPQTPLEELAKQTAKGIAFPGEPETVRDYIRTIHPGYQRNKPGRKKRK